MSEHVTNLTLEALIRHHHQLQLELTEEANELRVAKLKEAAEHARKVKQLVARLHKVKIDDLELGHWVCENSPTLRCFYNTREDPAMDFCLICGGPDERK